MNKLQSILLWYDKFIIFYFNSGSKEGVDKGYRPGFTNDDLMKLVFQRYGKSEAKGDSEKVNKREALEPSPDDEEDIQQKRAYPRPVPGSNSILAKHNEVNFNLLGNKIRKICRNNPSL